jgi:hypothetical protein
MQGVTKAETRKQKLENIMVMTMEMRAKTKMRDAKESG